MVLFDMEQAYIIGRLYAPCHCALGHISGPKVTFQSGGSLRDTTLIWLA